MALPWLKAALPNIITAGANAAFTGLTNLGSRLWSNRAYKKQRDDALAFWERENRYNDPRMQMQRLKNAGLSPHLAYGSANTTAGSIQTPDVQRPEFRTPKIDALASVLHTYQDLRIKQAQHDNLKMRNTLLQDDHALRQLLLGSRKLKLRYDQEVYDTQVDYKRNQLDLLKKQITSEGHRSFMLGKDAELREQNIMPTDQLWQRLMGQYLHNIGFDLKRLNIRNLFNN